MKRFMLPLAFILLLFSLFACQSLTNIYSLIPTESSLTTPTLPTDHVNFQVQPTDIPPSDQPAIPNLVALEDTLVDIYESTSAGVVAIRVLTESGRGLGSGFVIDKEGIIRYVDVHDIDLQPDNDVLIRVLEVVDPEAAERAAANAIPVEEKPFVEPDAAVVMYCTKWCPGCRRAREWFAKKDIEYVEVDITKERMAAEKVREWNDGSETTPTFNINGQIFPLFDIPRIEKALKGK